MNYADGPHVVTWELTRACQLHCRHCRARAIPRRDARELTWEEMLPVLDDIAQAFSHPPIMVFTGGDPLERPDLSLIIRSALNRRLTVALAPSVTPHLTTSVIQQWQELGVHAVSLSLDGPTADIHDKFRGFRGTFDRSLAIAKALRDSGMRLQINTSVGRQTVDRLAEMGQLVKDLGAQSWELFYVIPTGRARPEDTLTADEIEASLRWLAQWATTFPFRVTTVGAPQWIRIQHEQDPARPLRPIAREARGFAFIDHHGEVYPNGYLPLSAGSVRTTRFSAIYRESPLFRALRNPDQLKGGCGSCRYREFCGGSRARAYALMHDPLAPDPGCPWSRAAG
jgi:radical SAM protein with 4Fe4S-binding SPASM domain